MHPAIHRRLARAKVADPHRQASHDRLARAARRRRPARSRPARQRLPVIRVALTRQLFAVLGTRNP
jgi:hypothetical protein